MKATISEILKNDRGAHPQVRAVCHGPAFPNPFEGRIQRFRRADNGRWLTLGKVGKLSRWGCPAPFLLVFCYSLYVPRRPCVREVLWDTKIVILKAMKLRFDTSLSVKIYHGKT